MRKVIVGVITGLVLGMLWIIFLNLFRRGTMPTYIIWNVALRVILICTLGGAITGLFSLIISRIVLGAVIINIIVFLIFSWWMQNGSYTAGAVGGFINGLLIGTAIALIGQRSQPT